MMKHPIPRPQNELEAELYWGIFSSDLNLSIQGGTSQEGKNHLIYIGSGPSQRWLLNTAEKYISFERIPCKAFEYFLLNGQGTLPINALKFTSNRNWQL